MRRQGPLQESEIDAPELIRDGSATRPLRVSGATIGTPAETGPREADMASTGMMVAFSIPGAGIMPVRMPPDAALPETVALSDGTTIEFKIVR